MQITMRKYPSVTTGGKAYFYVAYYHGGRIGSIVWHRDRQAYAVEWVGRIYGYAADLPAARTMLQAEIGAREERATS